MTQLEKNYHLDDFDNSNLSDVDVKMMINELNDGGIINPERVRKYESEGYFDYQVSLLYVTLDTKRDNRGELSKKEQSKYNLLSNHMITFNKGFDQIVYEKKKKEIELLFQGLLEKAESGDEVAQKQFRQYKFTYNVEKRSDGELYEKFGGPKVYTYTKEGKLFYYILPFVSYSAVRDKDPKRCDPLESLVKNGIYDEEKTDYINNNRLTMGKFEELLATAQ